MADVDDLQSTDLLETYIEQSQCVLIFLSRGYFHSKNCMRELRKSLEAEKPLVLVHEPDESKGGASLEALKEECDPALRARLFFGARTSNADVSATSSAARRSFATLASLSMRSRSRSVAASS